MGIDPHAPNLAVQDQVISGPSWGAAALGPLYLLAMRAHTHALGLTLAILLLAFARFHPERPESLEWILAAVLAAVWFASVVGGKRAAWSSRRWRDFADFLACQRTWDRWGKGVLAVALVLVGLDRLLRAAALHRWPGAGEILGEAVAVGLFGASAVAAWLYLRRHHGRIRPWQRYCLRTVAVASTLACVASASTMLDKLHLPDAADLLMGGSMFLAGLMVAATAWQYERRTLRRQWGLRLALRLAVLPAVFVAAAGALWVFKTLRLPEAVTDAAIGTILVLGVLAVAWPALWRDPQAVRQAQDEVMDRRPPPRGVHLRAALDAVTLMARQPLLMLPLLVGAAIQGWLFSLVVLPDAQTPNPGALGPQGFLGLDSRFWYVTAAVAVLQTLATAMVSHMVAQLELARQISPGAALRKALIRLPALLGAEMTLFVRVFVGLVLLIIPGVVAFVRGALVVQAGVLGNAGPFRAIRISGELLRGHWWRMFFLLALEVAATILLTSTLGKVPHVGQYVATGLGASWVAITLTLLYLRLGGPAWETAPAAAV
ncbi:MAG: hypothetical protein QME77_03005 [bacterium]|nr:hypothetical protein [bacterium]